MSSRRTPVDAVLWSLSFALLAAVLTLSLGPAPVGLQAFTGADKVWHGAAYFVLTGSWLLAAVWRPGRGAGLLPRAAPWFVLGLAGMGAAIEILQERVDRTADPLDWVANVAGVVAATVVWSYARRR